MTEKSVWHIVKESANAIGLDSTRTSRSPPLCRIPDYAESSMKHLHLALSWRTKTIKPIRHSREGVIGLSGRPTGYRQVDSDLLLR
jgi:hypothetical protein